MTRSLRPAFLGLALASVAACAPPLPDSAPRGAGFDSPSQVEARRDTALGRVTTTPSQSVGPSFDDPTPLPATITPLPGQIAAAPLTEAEEIAADARAALGRPQGDLPPAVPSLPTTGDFSAPGLPASGPGSLADLDRDNPEISQEQDFDTVSEQRDIEADAERLRIARQQRETIAPTDLQRPDDSGPNIIAYALNQARPLGASGSFPRNPLATNRRADTRCQNYRTPDEAQAQFLASGGPERDRLGVDPDGDGNACAWDPAAYVSLVRNR